MPARICDEEIRGQKYGRLTAIKEVGKNKYGKRIWLCKCDCGNHIETLLPYLRNGDTKSCGCLKKEESTSLKDLTGKKFGRLYVISRSENHVTSGGQQKTMWKCQCDCGNIKVVSGNSLISGNTVSCGCKSIENTVNRNFEHGHAKERLYFIWQGMKSRCYNLNNSEYKNYGGFGILVCDEWKNNYANFRKWAYSMGYDETAPRGKYTLDRINPFGNYKPSNCRWITIEEQQHNRKIKVRKYICYGEKYTLRELSEKYGINYYTLKTRIRLGWEAEKAVNQRVERDEKHES